MEKTAIITAIIINVLGVGGMIFYAGRKIGTICTRLDTCSKNIGDLTLAHNKTNARVREVEIAVSAHTRVHKGLQGEL